MADREDILLRKLGKDCLNIYFSGCSDVELRRRFNKAVSDCLDITDDNVYTDSDSITLRS